MKLKLTKINTKNQTIYGIYLTIFVILFKLFLIKTYYNLNSLVNLLNFAVFYLALNFRSNGEILKGIQVLTLEELYPIKSALGDYSLCF